MFETRNWITGSNTDVLDCSAHWKRHYFLQALDDVFLNLCWICTERVCDCKNKSHIFTIQGPRTEKEYIFAFGLVEKGTSHLLLIYQVQQMSCKEKNLSSCVISQEEKYTFLKKNQAALYYNDHSTRMFPVFVQGFDSLHTWRRKKTKPYTKERRLHMKHLHFKTTTVLIFAYLFYTFRWLYLRRV